MRTKLSVFCEKIIEAGWLAAVVAVPLYFNIYSARTFEPDKITLLRAIVSIMILAWLVLVIEKGLNAPSETTPSLVDRFRRWLEIPLFLPTALLVLAYLISTIFSLAPVVSLWGSYQRMQGTYSALTYIVLFALMAGHLRTRQQVDRLVATLIITSIPISLYGIVQKYGLDPLPWAGDVTTRVASTMGNAIFVASYLIMIIPLTLVRLIESMTAIIKEEEASWGHTILAAVYIFALAVQVLTIIFSQSRGPMLGILGASFVMGLLILLILRRLHSDPALLSIKEIVFGVVFVGPLGLAGGLGGVIGFLLGLALQSLLASLNYELDTAPLLGAALGGLLGFLGLYTAMAAAKKGWRWLWVSWLGVAVGAIGFIILLNLRGTGLDPYLDPIRQLPYVDRLAYVIETEGTGRVRVLIWDAAMQLIMPHEPLGIPGDEVTSPDRFNVIRPVVGYGPESMFNAFAFVYPPELAHVELRGSSADRSHNETMDSLVITGVLGFLAFYFLMISLFYYGLVWLGWVPDQASKRSLIIWLLALGIIGAVGPYLIQGSFTFSPLFLPLGLITGVVLYLAWKQRRLIALLLLGLLGFIVPYTATGSFIISLSLVGLLFGLAGALAIDFILQKFLPQLSPAFVSPQETKSSYHLLLIGILGALIGHFIEVHFVFSIAATYTYFWAYVGLLVALFKMQEQEPAVNRVTPLTSEATPAEPAPLNQPGEVQETRKGRARRAALNRRAATVTSGSGVRIREGLPKAESWEMWMWSQGLAMAIILIILTFNFITPQFQFRWGDQNSMSLLWMFVITWGAGLAIALSEMAIRRENGSEPVNWIQAFALYAVPSVYSFFYMLVQQIQFSPRITVTSIDDVVRAAGVLANGVVVFDIFLLILMILFALMLAWRQVKGLALWRSENWWLYPPLAIAIIFVILFKNIHVVQADIYLKEGERYRNNGQWNEAIALHEKARSIDKDEDFYYLMLALDYQLMAQDGRIDASTRDFAWREGERIALLAREINPYNPDNTGNMGRYYFTLGQIFSPERFQDALKFFEKATILAPSNVIYHNLWAQTHYILQNYTAAIDRLEISVGIDPKYPPTWILLGDTYAAMGQVDDALKAHSQAMSILVREDGFALFADQFLDQRLNFYNSAGRLDAVIAAMEKVASTRPNEPVIQWAIGHAYKLQNQLDKAQTYFEKAVALGDNSDRTIRDLASTYLALNLLDQALSSYQLLLQIAPNDIEAHSALAFIYAQQGRLDEAIQENQLVLQQAPEDYDSLKNLAILYQQKELWQESLAAAKQAQAVAPEAEAPSWDQFIADLENRLAAAS